ncbi:hypothetical protein CDD83_3670 [Cordyceps sp. RAO-2017]|nr:hypothetical protein CDD83_3670 [Cordyceps sp. RAO-2017]
MTDPTPGLLDSSAVERRPRQCENSLPRQCEKSLLLGNSLLRCVSMPCLLPRPARLSCVAARGRSARVYMQTQSTACIHGRSALWHEAAAMSALRHVRQRPAGRLDASGAQSSRVGTK